MKITKIMLLLLVLLCTSNVWAQLSEKEHQSFTLENRIIKNMKTYVSNPNWNGTLTIELDGKQLCTEYGQGILLMTGQNLIERTSEIDVYSGGILSIRANRVGIGYTNVISLTIPEYKTDPILIVECTSSSHFPLNAYFREYY